jgi:hypothetical protein
MARAPLFYHNDWEDTQAATSDTGLAPWSAGGGHFHHARPGELHPLLFDAEGDWIGLLEIYNITNSQARAR